MEKLLPLTKKEIPVVYDLIFTVYLGLLRKKQIRNLFFGHLNIKSLRNKREYLEGIRNHFDIFLVSDHVYNFLLWSNLFITFYLIQYYKNALRDELLLFILFDFTNGFIFSRFGKNVIQISGLGCF